MLTCPPSPDVAPYHNRSIAILPPADCLHWLDTAIPAAELLSPVGRGHPRHRAGRLT
jgi:putative SOS response-associated peptidase YedK